MLYWYAGEDLKTKRDEFEGNTLQELIELIVESRAERGDEDLNIAYVCYENYEGTRIYFSKQGMEIFDKTAQAYLNSELEAYELGRGYQDEIRQTYYEGQICSSTLF